MPSEDIIDEEDYVSTPMVMCDACGGRFVLCPRCPQIRVDPREWVEITKTLQQKYEAVKCDRDEWNRLYHVFDGATATPEEREEFTRLQHLFLDSWKPALAQVCEWTAPVRRSVMRITRICTRQIYGKTWPEGTTEQQIREALASDEYESLPDNEYSGGDAPEVDDSEPLKWLTVDCFDAEETNVDGIDTSHDGISVCLRCRCDLCAYEAEVRYYGD